MGWDTQRSSSGSGVRLFQDLFSVYFLLSLHTHLPTISPGHTSVRPTCSPRLRSAQPSRGRPFFFCLCLLSLSLSYRLEVRLVGRQSIDTSLPTSLHSSTDRAYHRRIGGR